MLLNPSANANRSECTPNFNPIAVVREVTTAEWTDGIPPLQNIWSKSIFPSFKKRKIPFKNTHKINAILGTRIIYS